MSCIVYRDMNVAAMKKLWEKKKNNHMLSAAFSNCWFHHSNKKLWENKSDYKFSQNYLQLIFHCRDIHVAD